MSNEAIENARPAFDEANASGTVHRIQLFQAGSSHFGILADEIATIAAWREPTPLPHAPKAVLGVVSIQGRMLTVLDLARLHGDETIVEDAAAKQIVALRGDEQLALAVGAVGETIQLAAVSLNDLLPKETGGTLVLGVLQREGMDVHILNLKELFPTAIQGRERRQRRF